MEAVNTCHPQRPADAISHPRGVEGPIGCAHGSKLLEAQRLEQHQVRPGDAGPGGHCKGELRPPFGWPRGAPAGVLD